MLHHEINEAIRCTMSTVDFDEIIMTCFGAAMGPALGHPTSL